MNSWMTEERRQIARQYMHDMINSFVEEPETWMYVHLDATPTAVSFYSHQIENLLWYSCEHDSYALSSWTWRCWTITVTISTTSMVIVSIRSMARSMSEWRSSPWGRVMIDFKKTLKESEKAIKTNKFHVWLPKWKNFASLIYFGLSYTSTTVTWVKLSQLESNTQNHPQNTRCTSFLCIWRQFEPWSPTKTIHRRVITGSIEITRFTGSDIEACMVLIDCHRYKGSTFTVSLSTASMNAENL